MNVTHTQQRESMNHAINTLDTLIFAMRSIARHIEIAAIGDDHDKALALVDIEFEVWNALAAVGESP
jgi:hypothetical protein